MENAQVVMVLVANETAFRSFRALQVKSDVFDLDFLQTWKEVRKWSLALFYNFLRLIEHHPSLYYARTLLPQQF
jgi:hypothetical protein